MKIKPQFHFLLTLLFLSLTFASYGPARYIVEKTWTFDDSDGNLGDIGFTGYFLIRSPYQNVTITEYTKGVVLAETPDGVINVSYQDYSDEGHVDVIVKAIVDVYYEPHIFKDSQFQYKQLSYTNFTKSTPEMTKKALLLSDSKSMLSTTRALTAFTYSHITYNISYLGKLLSAEQAYAEQQGVCAEYAHMFAALSRSVGMDTHYVYGYVVDNGETQAHAWDVVEMPGFGLLPTDPTFNEVGPLSNGHVAAIYGADNNGAFEYYTASKGVSFDSTVDISTVWVKNSTMQPISAKCSFNQTTQMLTIDMKNSANEYKFFSYKYYVPTMTNQTMRGLMLLKPFEQTTIDYYINSTFQPGYNYYFYPFFSADDQVLCKNFIITVDLSDDTHNGNTVIVDYNVTYNTTYNNSGDWTDDDFTDDILPPAVSPFCCFPVFILSFILLFVAYYKRK